MCDYERFQCSSASRKFLNLGGVYEWLDGRQRFSALQRAENSSMPARVAEARAPRRFQCSSASRKFLNLITSSPSPERTRSFSALQRAENSSMSWRMRLSCWRQRVSVLFSEPKIPQFFGLMMRAAYDIGFSALQRAENSSIVRVSLCIPTVGEFQCSSASRKFLNPDPRTCVHPYFRPR